MLVNDPASALRQDLDDNWFAADIVQADQFHFRAIIEVSKAHNLFRFSIERYFGPAEEDEGIWPNGFWQSVNVSGLYSTAEDARREAGPSLTQISY